MTKDKSKDRLPIIEVTWEDTSYSIKAYSKDNVAKRKGLYDLKTVGYLVHEDDNRIALAMQQCIDSRDEIRHVCWIPQSAIKKRRELKENNG